MTHNFILCVYISFYPDSSYFCKVVLILSITVLWLCLIVSHTNMHVWFKEIAVTKFPYSSGSKGTAAKIKLASDPFLVSSFSHASSGSSGFFAYFFMPSQIFCAFLQVYALFFLAIKSDFLWSRERHNTLSSFRTHTTSPRLWHNFQRRNGESYSWSSRLSLGLWWQTCTYASSSCRFP